jgi:hypothetical protein
MTQAERLVQDSRSRRADDAERSNAPGYAATWTDIRPTAIAQRRWIDAIPHSPRVVAQAVMSDRIGGTLVASPLHRAMPTVKEPSPHGAVVIQGKGKYGELYKSGWKFSGGTMATYDLRAHWHASVFRVTSSGSRSETGLFVDGFHLTNSAFEPGEQPHVFFSHAGELEEKRTRDHAQSRKFVVEHGKAALDAQIEEAVDLASAAVKVLGPDLSAEEEAQLEADEEARSQEKARADAQRAEEAAAAAAAAQAEAEQSASEDEHIKLLLEDAKFSGTLSQFKLLLAGEDNARLPRLKKLAAWYKTRRDEGWVVTLGPVDKAPAIEEREGATREQRSRQVKHGKKQFTVTYTYKGYGTYRKDPNAEPIPEV